jgi:hypothetical protein
MSPSPSGPYQSRFLRAILSQTRRWLDRGQQAVRNVQVVAGWSVQILLYPVYALFQTTRLVGQQIGKAAQPEFPRLKVTKADQAGIALSSNSSLTADRPLQQVLQTVQSFAMTPIPVALQQSEVIIRGIAMQLEGRSLVLVTQQNQVLDILTPEQQRLLEQRMMREMAHHNRNSGIWRLPHWIGTRIRRLFGGGTPDPSLPASDSSSLILADSVALQVDAPVWQSLLTVEQFLEATEAQEQATQLAIASALTPASTIFIRGVASLLDERSLVLVTNHNQLLDVLTCEQQAVIQQRIIWEVANYYRYLQLRQRAQGLSPLNPPSSNSRAWLPVRVFQGLMAWMQSGPIAIATNLFQEAALPPASWPEADAPPILPSGNAPAIPGFLQKLQTRLIAALNPPSSSSQVEDNSSPTESSLFTASTSPSPVVAEHSTLLQRNGNKPLAGVEERSPEFIETDVTLIGYEFSWLERVIHWLDRCFLWVESRWSQLLNILFHRSSRSEDE